MNHDRSRTESGAFASVLSANHVRSDIKHTNTKHTKKERP